MEDEEANVQVDKSHDTGSAERALGDALVHVEDATEKPGPTTSLISQISLPACSLDMASVSLLPCLSSVTIDVFNSKARHILAKPSSKPSIKQSSLAIN